MAYYGGISPVQHELQRTSQLIGGGLREHGQSKLRSSEMGLKRAEAERGLQLFERYQKPELEMNLKKIAYMNEPARLDDFVGQSDVHGLVHALQPQKDGMPELYKAIGGALGGDAYVDPETRSFMRPDGSYVSKFEVSQKWPMLQKVMGGYFDAAKTAEIEKQRLEMALGEYGGTLEPRINNTIKRQIAKIDNALKDPVKRLEMLDQDEQRALEMMATIKSMGGDISALQPRLTHIENKRKLWMKQIPEKTIPKFTETPEGMLFKEGLETQGKIKVERVKGEEARKTEGVKEKTKAPSYDMLTVYGPKGKTKRVSVKKGDDYMPDEGWTLSKPPEGGQITPKYATKRVTDIEKIRATVEKTDEMTAALIAMIGEGNPDLAKALTPGQIKPELKERLFSALDRERAYLEQFIPEEFQEAPPKATHVYTREKGYQAIGQ